MKIEGKLALVTGASSGIGEATARALASKKAHVVLVARSESRLREIVRQISEKGGKAGSFAVDLSRPDAVHELAKTILQELGTPDIIINNAGAGRWLTIEETASSELEMMTALPYFASFNVTREFLSSMRKRGSGHIVNITSVASRLSWPGAAGYASARAAMAAFSRALEAETHGSGIEVTLAMFGKVASTFWEHNPGSEERLPRVNTYLPTLTPEQVAGSIVSAIERGSRIIVLPRIFRLFFLLDALFPRATQGVMHSGWKGGA